MSRSTSPPSPPSSPACSGRPIERAGLTLEVDCPPLRRARLHRPRHVGEGGPQPAVERVEVHLRRRHRASACAARTATPWSRWRTPGSVWPPTEMPRLFERFHRIENVARAVQRGQRNRAGAGARSWSSCTAARITADSVEGGGTTFTIRLPSGAAHLPAGRVCAGRREPGDRPRVADTVSCRRRCAGCPPRP